MLDPDDFCSRNMFGGRWMSFYIEFNQLASMLLTNMLQRVHLLFPILQSLLCDPNPNSPANSEAARMFSENKREYNRRVREIVEQSWTAD